MSDSSCKIVVGSQKFCWGKKKNASKTNPMKRGKFENINVHSNEHVHKYENTRNTHSSDRR